MASLENSKKIIKTWTKKGDGERNKFSKFICYWIAFNCQLYTITHEIEDGNALKKLYKESSLCNTFEKLVFNNEYNFKNKVENFKKICPVKNDRKNIPGKDISEINNFREVIKVIC